MIDVSLLDRIVQKVESTQSGTFLRAYDGATVVNEVELSSPNVPGEINDLMLIQRTAIAYGIDSFVGSKVNPLTGVILGVKVGSDLLPAFGKTYTWASRPDATTCNGAIIFISDVAGGAYFRSDGTRWKPISAVLTLGQQNTPVTAGANSNENILYSLTIPAGLMGPNDSLRVSPLASYTSSANNKTFRMRLGGISGTAFLNNTLTTTQAVQNSIYIRNRNSVTSQIGFAPASSGQSAAQSLANVTGAVDMDAEQDLIVSAQKATAGETFTLESVVVELMRGA